MPPTTICSRMCRPTCGSAASGASPPTARASTSMDPATEQTIASVASATVDDAMAARRCGQARVRRLGRQDAARARRDSAQGLRADHARRRAAREADHPRERQGAVGLARRGRLRGRVLPLVRRGSRAQSSARSCAAPASRRAHARAAQAGRHRRAGDAVELPGRDGDPQDRPGARRRLLRWCSSPPPRRR